jgi:rubredoxin
MSPLRYGHAAARVAETIVVETRPGVYPPRRKAHREIVWKKPLQRLEKQDDPGGTGWEVVREIQVCPPCKRLLQPDSVIPTP